MANHHVFVPIARNAGASRRDIEKSAQAEAEFQREVDRLHSLAVDPRDRFYGLYRRYDDLRTELGEELPAILAQIRSDLLRAIGQESLGDWRSELEHSQVWEEYASTCSEVVNQRLRSLRTDERILQLARGNEKTRRLIRVVITQLLTFLEATCLPGPDEIAAEPTTTSP